VTDGPAKAARQEGATRPEQDDAGRCHHGACEHHAVGDRARQACHTSEDAASEHGPGIHDPHGAVEPPPGQSVLTCSSTVVSPALPGHTHSPPVVTAATLDGDLAAVHQRLEQHGLGTAETRIEAPKPPHAVTDAQVPSLRAYVAEVDQPRRGKPGESRRTDRSGWRRLSDGMRLADVTPTRRQRYPTSESGTGSPTPPPSTPSTTAACASCRPRGLPGSQFESRFVHATMGSASGVTQVQAGEGVLLAHAARVSAVDAIAGLVWDAIDAEASRVDVTLELRELGAPMGVAVGARGHGMTSAVSLHGGRWKADARFSPRVRRPMHGRLGRGRSLAAARTRQIG
jgi:hypothetical protein